MAHCEPTRQVFITCAPRDRRVEGLHSHFAALGALLTCWRRAVVSGIAASALHGAKWEDADTPVELVAASTAPRRAGGAQRDPGRGRNYPDRRHSGRHLQRIGWIVVRVIAEIDDLQHSSRVLSAQRRSRGADYHRSATDTPRRLSRRRVNGKLSPMTLDGSPSIRSTNQPPSPSRVKPPATANGSPLSM
jgi:hypothetical protein